MWWERADREPGPGDVLVATANGGLDSIRWEGGAGSARYSQVLVLGLIVADRAWSLMIGSMRRRRGR